jgi:predicted RNA binding protein YcfA (HicA-like mRNA interferase family)
MSKLPLITVKNFEKLLFEKGFEFKRQQGKSRFLITR